MRILLISLLLHMLLALNTQSQCTYENFSNAPKELLRKRVKDNEPGFRYGNPYTMFNRSHYPNWSLNEELNRIRQYIFNGTPLIGEVFRNESAKLYSKIFLEIKVSNEPAKCGERSTKCPHAAWVKNNAVIYMVGLGYATDQSGKGYFWQLSQDSINLYAQRAKTGLQTV